MDRDPQCCNSRRVNSLPAVILRDAAFGGSSGRSKWQGRERIGTRALRRSAGFA